jgi:hypothetical protein
MRPIQIAAAILFVVSQGIVFQGCAEDTVPSGSTAINGRVLNTNGDPIDGAGIVVEYSTLSAGSAPAFPQTADGKVVLKAPYPNPTTTGGLSIPLQVAADTTMKVEIRGSVEGATQTIELLKNGLVTKDTLLTWDGFDPSGWFPHTPSPYAPNGMYHVRVTVPASGAETVQLEMPVLVNQPGTFNTVQETFNDVSVLGGDYTIIDLPVGEYYTGTQSNGTVRGRERVSDTILLVISANNYATQEVPVTITPGDVVSITTTLTANAPLIARP